MQRFILSAAVLAVLAVRADALKCFVGKGNSSLELPADEESQKEHLESQTDRTPFRIMECGKKNSELYNIDRLVKNVTDQIQSGLSGAANKAKEALSRRKRASEAEAEPGESKHACAKIQLGPTSYRSCVPKIGDIKLECTSALNSLSLCYCHEDQCNKAAVSAGPVQAALVLALAVAAAAGINRLDN